MQGDRVRGNEGRECVRIFIASQQLRLLKRYVVLIGREEVYAFTIVGPFLWEQSDIHFGNRHRDWLGQSSEGQAERIG